MSKQATINDYLMDKARASLTMYMIQEADSLRKQLGFGYVENPAAPNTFKDLRAAFAQSMATKQPLMVYDGGSENTVYTSKEGNWAFRFCHDVAHVLLGANFGPVGEAQVSRYQAEKIAKRFGKDSPEYRIFTADTLGQVAYYQVHKDYPGDQLQFVRAMLATY